MKSEVRSPKSEAAPTLVCFALKDEAGAFQKIITGRDDVAILITGIGRVNSEKLFRRFLERGSPQRVFTCGFAGGLNPELATSDVIFETDDEALRSKLTSAGARPGRFFCSSQIASTAREKAELCRTTNADAVEMESEVIHSVCRERGIPCATVRAISDMAHEDMPLDFNKLSKPDQNLDFAKLAWAIAKSPVKIPALLRLQKHCSLAANRLADVLAKVVQS